LADQYTEVSLNNKIDLTMSSADLIKIMTKEIEETKILLLNLLVVQRRKGDDCSQRLSFAVFNAMSSAMIGSFASQYFDTEVEEYQKNNVPDEQGGYEMTHQSQFETSL